MRSLTILLILLVFLVSVPGFGQWVQSDGPYGGVIFGLAVSAIGPGGTNIIAGSGGGGLFLSTDDGATWRPVPSDLEYVTALQASGENLVAADPNKGVFLSKDGGTTWASINSNIGDATVFKLGVAGGDLYAGTASGTYRSSDLGSSWIPIGSLLSAHRVNCVASVGNKILAGTDFGMFVSTDGGTQWSQANAGPWDVRVSGMTVSGTMVFAATSGGVFRSADAGATWQPANNGLANPVVTCIISSPGPGGGSTVFAGTYYGGVFRSTNGGADWVEVNSGLRRRNVHSLVVTETGVLAGVEGGLYRSVDRGDNWLPAATGLAAHPVRSLLTASDGTGGTAVFAACEADGGIFRSMDSGVTWEETTNGLEDLLVLSLAARGTDLFAGTFSMGVYRSTDLGSTWTRATPTNFGNLAAALLTDGTNLYAGTANGVCRSADGGTQWTPPGVGITHGQVSCLALCGGILFAGTHGGGVYRSANGGDTWTSVNGGLPSLLVSSMSAQEAILFAGTADAGVFRSVDNGQNWVPANDGLTVPGIRSLYTHGENLFAGTGDGVFLSTDGGASWTSVAIGLKARGVLALGSAAAYLLAGISAGSVWRRPLAEMLPSEQTNLLSNPGFDSGRESWKFYTNGGGTFVVATAGGNAAARLDIKAAGKNVQLYQAGISLKGTARYRLRFKAYSSSGNDIYVFLHKHDAPHTSYGLHGWRCDLGTSWKTYVTEFDVENIRDDVDDARLRFWLASTAGAGDRYFIDDVELEEMEKGPPGQSNLVLNGGFQSADARWDFFTDGAGSFGVEPVVGEGSQHAACVRIAAPGLNAQLYQSGLRLHAGASYLLRFKAYSPTGRPLGIYIHKHGAPYTDYGLSMAEVDLGDSWGSYALGFTAHGFKGACADGRIRFWFARHAKPGDEYYLDDISLTRLDEHELQKSQKLAVAEEEQAPGEYRLTQNYPNPFNGRTVIRSSVPPVRGGTRVSSPPSAETDQMSEARHVKLAVYDLLGREVDVLVDEQRGPGIYHDTFDGTGLASGTYFYRMTAGSYVETRKLILTR